MTITNNGVLVYTTTVFDNDKKNVLYSGQLESNSLSNAMEVFSTSVEKTPPDNIIGGWVPEDGLPKLTIQVETGGLGLRKEVTIGIGLVDSKLLSN